MTLSRPLAVLLAASCMLSAIAQKTGIDPYTKNDKALLAAAGIVRVGDQSWADDHDTQDIRGRMTRGPLHILETAHFRIAMAVGARKIPETSANRRRLGDELDRLRKKLPGVPVKPKVLDPWLLVHLYAQRAEELYDDLATRFGVTAASFPATGTARKPGQVGRGPHFGRRGKFTLLVFQTEADMVRYQTAFTDRREGRPMRIYHRQSDSLGYVTSVEAHKGVLEDEAHMHANVVFSLALNLIDGFDYYDPDHVPLWFREGLAHVYRRRAQPEHNNFSDFDDRVSDRYRAANWSKKVHGRVKAKVDPYPPLLYGWTEPGNLPLAAHAMMWSRAEFMVSLGDDKMAKFVRSVKKRPFYVERWDSGEVVAWHDEVMGEALGMKEAAFTKQWREWVLREYPGRSN